VDISNEGEDIDYDHFNQLRFDGDGPSDFGEWLLSVSNDGERFSTDEVYRIYDGKCMECNNNGHTSCTVKVN